MNNRLPSKWGGNNRPTPALPTVNGFGSRAGFPLPPVGEAARRDPHIPDPYPNPGKPTSQREASPPVAHKHGIGVGDGIVYEGLPPSIVYVKRLGTLVQRALARTLLAANFEARWRVGGIGYPLDYGYGPGYHGDAATVWPNNPQTYMRNPGIRPIYGVPQTFRYAPNMPSIQPLGPTIGDFGNATVNQLPSNASPSTLGFGQG